MRGPPSSDSIRRHSTLWTDRGPKSATVRGSMASSLLTSHQSCSWTGNSIGSLALPTFLASASGILSLLLFMPGDTFPADPQHGAMRSRRLTKVTIQCSCRILRSLTHRQSTREKRLTDKIISDLNAGLLGSFHQARLRGGGCLPRTTATGCWLSLSLLAGSE